MEKEMNSVKTTKGVLNYYLDWECEGAIAMENPQTVKHYKEIKNSHPDCDEHGVFFAFANEQFAEGKAHLIEIGKIREDEKLVSVEGINGLFGTSEGVCSFLDFYDKKPERIKKECDPQEVYFYEYNNHECMIGYGGDADAISIIIEIWGEEVARGIVRHSSMFNDLLQ